MSGTAPRSCIHSADRRGFTLVELLVVITIIGILMALLLPVLGMARAAARRVSCMNNQREIGQAMIQYATTKGQMPPEMKYFQETAPGVTAGTPYMLGWAEYLMGFLGRNDLAPGTLAIATLRGNPTTNPPTYPPNVAVLVCPSDSIKSGSTGGPLSYVVNGGCPNSTITTTGSTLPVDWNANGAWNYSGGTTTPATPPTATSYNSGLNTNISLEYIAKHDGASTTIALSENLDATNYTFGTASINGSSSGVPQTESSQAILWYPGQTTPTGSQTANPPIDYYPPGVSYTLGGIDAISNSYGAGPAGFTAIARPSSNHPGGAVFTFCDGSVKFIQTSLSYSIYAALMTSNGSQVSPPGQSFTAAGGANNTYYKTQPVDASGNLIPLDSSQIPMN